MLLFSQAAELSYLSLRKKGRRGNTERESGASMCMYYNSVLWELAYLQLSGWISYRHPLELCWRRQSRFCATWALAAHQEDAAASVMLRLVQAAAQYLFWVQGSVYRDPLRTLEAGASQGTLLPAVLCSVVGQCPCPAAGGEQCQRALPSHLHAG